MQSTLGLYEVSTQPTNQSYSLNQSLAVRPSYLGLKNNIATIIKPIKKATIHAKGLSSESITPSYTTNTIGKSI